jgi:hypothetical protein
MLGRWKEKGVTKEEEEGDSMTERKSGDTSLKEKKTKC